jgi:hypothetical protein
MAKSAWSHPEALAPRVFFHKEKTPRSPRGISPLVLVYTFTKILLR